MTNDDTSIEPSENDDERLRDLEVRVAHLEAERGGRYARNALRSPGPCPCECNSGGFCGGCGHAGCGGRRR